MLIHLVVWKYRDDVSQEVRDDHRSKLKALEGLVPGMMRLEVGADVLGLDRSYDTGLSAAFDDKESLDAYTVHERHAKVAALGKTIASHVVSVDFYV